MNDREVRVLRYIYSQFMSGEYTYADALVSLSDLGIESTHAMDMLAEAMNVRRRFCLLVPVVEGGDAEVPMIKTEVSTEVRAKVAYLAAMVEKPEREIYSLLLGLYLDNYDLDSLLDIVRRRLEEGSK